MRIPTLTLLGLTACSGTAPEAPAPTLEAPAPTVAPAGDADLSLVYSSRMEGELEPCG